MAFGELFFPVGYTPLHRGEPVPGGKLQFFQTDTETEQNTFSDSGLTVPNTNPIELDSSGALTTKVYGDPSSFDYRVRLLNSADVMLWTYDDVVVQPDPEPIDPYFAITAAEIAAGVTPTSFQYAVPPSFPVVNVLRYGADPTGVADSRAAFLAALSVADAFVPYGTYRIDGRLPLTEYGLIGEGWGEGGTSRKSQLVFYNQTDTALGSIYTDYDNWKGRAIPIKHISLWASSWNGSTGALGYGIDITAQVDMEDVDVQKFGKSGIFLHNTDTDGEAPYRSVLRNVTSSYNGNHGFIVGAGANLITLMNCEGKYNGAPSYGVAPSVAGSYDGLYVSRDDDGNPGSAYYSYLMEEVRIIGGNFSYNSRYGSNFLQCQAGVLSPGYHEGNLHATYQINLSNGLTNCLVMIGQVAGGVTKVNFGCAATISSGGDTNRVFVGGLDCGAGNNNTAANRYSYILNEQWNWVAIDSGETNGAVIRKYGTDGRARLARVGNTGGFFLEPPRYLVASLPTIGDFSAGAVIFVPDEAGGSVIAFSDGTNWRRVTDRAIVS